MPTSPTKEGLSLRETAAAAALLALFLFLATFIHYVHGQGLARQVIWDPVAVYSFYTGDQFAIDAFQSGRFPLWDHTRGLGAPHVAPTFGTVDYPLRIMAYIINSNWGWELYFLSRLFLAGLLFFLFARDGKISFFGSLFGAVGFMLCGFFREFHNLPDVNVLNLFPLLLLLERRLFRKATLANSAGYILTGHVMDNSPESTAFMCFIVMFYAVYLASAGMSDKGRGLKWALGRLLLLGSLTAYAFFLSCSGMWQFAEFYARAWHFHPEGLGRLHVPISSAIGLVTPLFDYWIFNAPTLSFENMEQLTLVPAYWGVPVFTLALVGLSAPKRLSRDGLFHAAGALVTAGMLFSAPPFNLLLDFPLIRYFQNFRYIQPFVAFFVCMLAGMGLDLAIKLPGKRRLGAKIALFVLAWTGVHAFIFRSQVMATSLAAIGLAAIFFGYFIFALLVYLARKRGASWTMALGPSLVLVTGLELAGYFAIAVPVFGPEAFKLEASPEVKLIQSRGGDGPFRIWGADQRALHPNLAGLWGLMDLRDYNPLYVDEYALMMAGANGCESGEETMNHFLADGKFYFDLDFDKINPSLLGLLNVRYVLSYGEPGSRPMDLDPQKTRALTGAPGMISFAEIALRGVARKGVIEHAPALIEAALPCSAGGKIFMEAGVIERASTCEGADGVMLGAVRTKDGRESLAFARLIRADRDKRWIPLKLAPGGGDLLLSSLPGPRDDVTCDFGVWSLPTVPPKNAGVYPDPIHDGDFQIREVPSFQPRVFGAKKIVDQKPRAGDFGRDADDMTSGTFKVPGAKPGDMAEVLVQGVRVEHDGLTFHASSEGEGFAIISDLYFPGWRAFRDGKEIKIYKVADLLKGVEIQKGEHGYRLSYEPPGFRVGIWNHLFGVLFILFLFAAKAFGRGGVSRN